MKFHNGDKVTVKDTGLKGTVIYADERGTKPNYKIKYNKSGHTTWRMWHELILNS